jgi:Lon protease-like protein
MPSLSDFPLFPLGMVALPGELVTLHIFEQRYKTMIGQCLEQGGEFGIVWMSDTGLREIGCACRIDRVLERMEDGRMNILAVGTRPIRVLERQGHLPYPAGVIEFVEDREEISNDGLAREVRGAYAKLVTRATGRELGADELEGLDAYAMAATVALGTDAKQGLLDLRSENARLRLLRRLLRSALERLRFADRAETRARSNGKIRFGPASAGPQDVV